MAEEQQEDRTEDPSPRRLSQAHEKGDFPMSRELATYAGVAAAAVVLIVYGPMMRDALVALVRSSVDTLHTSNPQDLVPFLARPALLVLAASGAAALAATAVLGWQTGGGIWLDRALPDLSRVFSGGKLGQLFSKQFLADLGMSLVKIVAIGMAVWFVFRHEFLTLPGLLESDPGTQLAALFGPLSRGLVKILAALALIAGVDLALQKRRYTNRMKMTKQEVKREHRDDEGDPQIKGKRRKRHREIVKNRVVLAVPRADALIVNPTHIAVAVRYRPTEGDPAPRVTAKGKGYLAGIMRDIARKNGIPIIQDKPLARLLYRRVKVGRCIPAETYKAVAAVLAFVYRVLGRSGVRAGGAR